MLVRWFAVTALPLCFACADVAPSDDVDVDIETPELAGASCQVSGTDASKSLMVTDPVVLARFDFPRTMTQILGSDAPGIFSLFMEKWGFNPPDPNRFGVVTPRAEYILATRGNPIDPNDPVQFKPVAIVNRFDLAPKNGDTCGEYRIIYAMSSTHPEVGGRAFIIFEAALPNPDPAKGIKGCLPVAQFWQGLSNLTSSRALADALEKFYYLGTAIAGVGPAVDIHNYGHSVFDGTEHPPGPGQIRTNMFISSFIAPSQWHLREFTTHEDCFPGCAASLRMVTTSNNPANTLFEGTAERSGAFRTAFRRQVGALSSSDPATIGMFTARPYLTAESVSQPDGRAGETSVRYASLAGTKITTAVNAELVKRKSSLTATNIFDRATTQTCAGCHQLSNNADLGNNVRWPQSLGFVHVDEQRNLSPALTTTFLPHRLTVLEKFINKNCGQAKRQADVDDGLTVGGAPVGAAN